MHKLLRFTFHSLLCVVVATTFAGCGRSKSKGDPVSASTQRPDKEEGNLSTWESNNRIRSALDSGDEKKAESLAKARLEKHPEDAKTYFLLGKALAARNKDAAAKEALEKAYKLDTKNGSYKRELGNILSRMATNAMVDGDHESAITNLKACRDYRFRSLRTDRDLLVAYLACSRQLLNKGSLEKGEKVIREAINDFPEKPQPRVVYAEFMMAGDRLMEAKRELKSIIKDHPNFPPANLALARLHR